jgi:hypothetical protein
MGRAEKTAPPSSLFFEQFGAFLLCLVVGIFQSHPLCALWSNVFFLGHALWSSFPVAGDSFTPHCSMRKLQFQDSKQWVSQL